VYIPESAGIRLGSFRYNFSSPTVGDVPAIIMSVWILLGCLAYYISKKHGTLISVLSIFSVDLVLEPVAYYTGLWTWLDTATPQVYFGATLGNMMFWLLYPLVAIQLFGWTEKMEKRRVP